jgi:hypothetical protein
VGASEQGEMRARCTAGAPSRRDTARAAGPHCRIQEGGRAARDPSGLLHLLSAGKQHAKIRRRPPRAKISRSMRAADRSCRGGRGPRARPDLQGREPWGRGATRERESGAAPTQGRSAANLEGVCLGSSTGQEWSGEREGVWWQWQETGPGSKKREVDKRVAELHFPSSLAGIGWSRFARATAPLQLCRRTSEPPLEEEEVRRTSLACSLSPKEGDGGVVGEVASGEPTGACSGATAAHMLRRHRLPATTGPAPPLLLETAAAGERQQQGERRRGDGQRKQSSGMEKSKWERERGGGG